MTTLRKKRMRQLSHKEIARLLGVTHQCVQATEKRALEKLRHHPIMRNLAKDLWEEPEEDDMGDYRTSREKERVAFNAGSDAAVAGKPFGACPYDIDRQNRLYAQWRAGYADVMRAKKRLAKVV